MSAIIPPRINSVESMWMPREGINPQGLPSMSALARRILLLASLFTAELLTITYFLDRDTLIQRTGFIGIIYNWGAWILHGIVGFAAIFVTFAYFKNKAQLERISGEIPRSPIRWSFLISHVAALSIFAGLSFLLYYRSGSWAEFVAASWFVAGAAAIAFAGFAFLPLSVWIQLFRITGNLWVFATTAVIAACAAGIMAEWLWQPACQLTFRLSKFFLGLFVSDIVADPSNLVIGTQGFQVEISPGCSGLEGVGLILAFAILWLWAFRREYRFPRSIILVPVGIVLMFVLNSLRIAALILIGNAGAEQIALGGFHSQAGWIAFSVVGVGFCFVIQRVPWFTTNEPKKEVVDVSSFNPTAAFLLPFLAIVAAGMIASAVTGDKGVEWVYPLKFFAALGTLWIFRKSYSSLNWRWDWFAPAIGAFVFLLWVSLDAFSNSVAEGDFSFIKLGSTTAANVSWLAFRVLVAVVAVPLAEELAFRGYLMRRLLSQDFDSVPLQRFSWGALLVSSVAFGLLHGGYWMAGTFAGILFGLAVIRRGRIGDAVVAHATANALLAGYILTFHKWHLW